jgi:hypothetical protein
MEWFTVSIATFDRMRMLEISKQCSHILLECVDMVPKLTGLLYGNRDDFKDCTCTHYENSALMSDDNTFMHSIMIDEYFDRCMKIGPGVTMSSGV